MKEAAPGRPLFFHLTDSQNKQHENKFMDDCCLLHGRLPDRL